MSSSTPPQSLQHTIQPDVQFTDSIDAVVDAVPAASLHTHHGNFRLLAGIYDELASDLTTIDALTPPSPQNRTQGPASKFEIRYESAHEVPAAVRDEIATASRVFVDYTDRWAPALDRESDADAAGYLASQDEPKYCVGGLLVYPTVTADPETAAAHLERALSVLPERVECLCDRAREDTTVSPLTDSLLANFPFLQPSFTIRLATETHGADSELFSCD